MNYLLRVFIKEGKSLYLDGEFWCSTEAEAKQRAAKYEAAGYATHIRNCTE